MSAVDQIPVHWWTRRWWESLPAAYQSADAAQQAPRLLYQVGFNSDPTFTEGFDGWDVTKLDVPDGYIGLSFERPFFAVQRGQELYFQTWWDADEEGAEVALRLVDATGAVLAVETETGIGRGPGTLKVTAPNPQRAPITARLSFITPVGDRGLLFELKAVSIGHGLVSYEALPGVAATTAFPLLRYMDGAGRIAGEVRDLVDALWSGEFMDPATTPASSLRWLAQLLGVGEGMRELTDAEVRQFLVDLAEQGRPATGTRSHIGNTVKQFLNGDRRVAVVPSKSRPHSLILILREDEVPNADLPALIAKVRATGVIPAGHELTASTAVPTWDQWEAAAGVTWDDREDAARTWSEADSLGVNIEEGV